MSRKRIQISNVIDVKHINLKYDVKINFKKFKITQFIVSIKKKYFVYISHTLLKMM